MHSELVNYIETESLDPEDNSILDSLKSRLHKLEGYKKVLEKFNLSRDWFREIDPYITEAAYLGCDDVLKSIKHGIGENIQSIHVTDFNTFLTENKSPLIWNHWDLLEKHLNNNVDWHGLSGNPNAITILEKHLDKVNWEYLSDNIYNYHKEKIASLNKLKLFTTDFQI